MLYSTTKSIKNFLKIYLNLSTNLFINVLFLAKFLKIVYLSIPQL